MQTAVQENLNEEQIIAQTIINGLMQPNSLIYMLHELQGNLGYISEDAIFQMASALKTPVPELLGTVSFHRQFKLKMKSEQVIVARHTIRLCSGAPCFAKGSLQVRNKITHLLGIPKGETTPDKRFFFEVVDCLGACGTSPIMMIDEDIYGGVSPDQVVDYLAKYE